MLETPVNNVLTSAIHVPVVSSVSARPSAFLVRNAAGETDSSSRARDYIAKRIARLAKQSAKLPPPLVVAHAITASKKSPGELHIPRN